MPLLAGVRHEELRFEQLPVCPKVENNNLIFFYDNPMRSNLSRGGLLATGSNSTGITP